MSEAKLSVAGYITSVFNWFTVSSLASIFIFSRRFSAVRAWKVLDTFVGMGMWGVAGALLLV